jgi:hypothetical protein
LPEYSFFKTITFIRSPLIVFIQGGNRSHNLNDDLSISLFFSDRDFDVASAEGVSPLVGVVTIWKCFDLVQA